MTVYHRDFAEMSDPLKNPQFRRQWTEPPDKRKRRPGGGGAPNLNTSNSTANIDDQTLRLQAAWGLA